MRAIFLILAIPLVVFSSVPMSPVYVFEGSREYLRIDVDLSAYLSQNLLTLQDIIDIANGKEILVDKSRLELLGNEGFMMSPQIRGLVYLGLGSRAFKIGAFGYLQSDVAFNLPKEFMRVIFGDVEYNEDMKKEFDIFRGGVYAKSGGTFGWKMGNLSLAVSGGAYLPLVIFTKDSTALFEYHSSLSEGKVEAKIAGNVRLLSALSSFSNVDTSKVVDSLGYYADVGAVLDLGRLKVGGGINGITISPAKVSYEGSMKISWEASLVNLELNQKGPDYEISNELRSIPPEDAPLPMEYVAFASYDLGGLELSGRLAGGGKSNKYGFGLSLWKLLTFDFETLGKGMWKKSVQLDIDFRSVRMSAEIGVVDTGGLLNFDTDKMTGLTVYMGMSMGW